jgi:hypothetical protein
MIIQHGGLDKDSLEFKVALEWNRKIRLKTVVEKLGNKNKVVQYWKKFFDMVPYGTPLPHNYVHGKIVDTKTADPVWLAHHGYTGNGAILKECLEKNNENI